MPWTEHYGRSSGGFKRVRNSSNVGGDVLIDVHSFLDSAAYPVPTAVRCANWELALR